MLSDFRLARYHLTLEALEPLRLPPFKGSALRGGFGHAFKRLVCFSPKGTSGQSQLCGPRCELGNACPYGYVFETSPPPGSQVLRNLDEVPRPFVIRPPADRREVIPAGERLAFGLTLIGRGIDYLPYFIAVFRELGREGLGRTRGKYRLLSVDGISPPTPNPSPRPCHSAGLRREEGSSPAPSSSQGEGRGGGSPAPSSSQGEGRGGGSPAPSPLWGEGWGGGRVPLYSAADDSVRIADVALTGAGIQARAAALPADRLTLEFLTPARLKQAGRWVESGPPFDVLVRTLLARVSSLSYFHCGQRLEVDFRELIDRAAGVRVVQAGARWEDWARFSGRQQQRIEMGGLVGRVAYAGDLAEYLPLLALGELIHAGKGTVFGNGQYAIEAGSEA